MLAALGVPAILWRGESDGSPFEDTADADA
jgi:hypothetical protein